MAKTPEGEARFARSYAAIGNVGILDGEDREFGIRLRENRINSQSIAMLKNQFASDRTQLSAARQQLEPVLLRLKKIPISPAWSRRGGLPVSSGKWRTSRPMSSVWQRSSTPK